MLQALHAEWQKARRRHDLMLCLVFAVILYLWLGSTAPTGQDELANAYSALFYGVPIINTILLPVLMAVLASRLWDVEVKGCTAKLLYTLQSRRSLFFGKAVFGLGEIVLMVALKPPSSCCWGTRKATPRPFLPGSLPTSTSAH